MDLINNKGTVQFSDVINDWEKREDDNKCSTHQVNARRAAVGDVIRAMKDPCAFIGTGVRAHAPTGDTKVMVDDLSSRGLSLPSLCRKMADAFIDTENTAGPGAATVVSPVVFNRITTLFNDAPRRMAHMLHRHIRNELRAFKKGITNLCI